MPPIKHHPFVLTLWVLPVQPFVSWHYMYITWLPGLCIGS